jgi:predicted dehydrogenase
MTDRAGARSSLGIGIVGMGYGAAVLLPAARALAGARVVALADSGSGRAAAVAADLAGARALDTAALVAAEDVDLVIAAVPPAAQAAVIEAVLAHGKALLCEKPLARDAAEAADLAGRVAAAGLPAAVSLQFRYDPGLRALRELIAGGALGALRRIDVTWLTGGGASPERPWSWRHDRAAGGGIVADFAVHVLDYLTWLSGAPITAVSGRTLRRIAARPGPDGHARPVTAADECDLALRLGDDLAAHVTVSNTYPLAFGHRIEIHGTGGRALLHHRPPFGPDDRTLRLETARGGADLPIADAEPAGIDGRVMAAGRLLTDLRRRMAGTACPDLPTLAEAATLRRVMERIDTLAEVTT